MRKIFKIILILIVVGICIVIATVLAFRDYTTYPDKGYIAHAGGAIDSCTYTNSREAVENALAKGYKLIELDFGFTSDSVLVAFHDWLTFNSFTVGDSIDTAVPYSDFMSRRIYGKYHPLSAAMVDSIFSRHPDVTLVTDKIDDIDILLGEMPNLKGRMIVECFSPEAYAKVKASRDAIPINSIYWALTEGKTHNIRDYLSGYTMTEYHHRELRHTLPYYVITRLLNYPVAVYILYSSSDREAADTIFEDDRVKYVYIDHL